MKTPSLVDAIEALVTDKKAYYKQWVFDEPVVVGKSHNEELKKVQQIMHRLITHFVINYDRYEHLMPVSPEVKRILELSKPYKYQVGTYRTDFVYDQNDQVRLLEITCRFALNGVFLPAIMQSIANDLNQKQEHQVRLNDVYSSIFEYLEELIGSSERIIVLQGADRRNESKLFIPVFEKMGLSVVVLDLSEIDSKAALFFNSFIISELALDEILTLSQETIKSLLASNMINDLRTVFLIHDKRFFSVLYNEDFRRAVLNKDENDFFTPFLIPTYASQQHAPMWENCRNNKDRWVLKHATLGKSQSVYAGVVTSKDDWNNMFEQKMVDNMVIQEWITTDRVKGSIAGDEFYDYLTGTLMFFNKRYFGFGDFRTSSYPVTNKKDHRKACTFVLTEEFDKTFPYLKYI
ncbi:hypothetical protein [Roseivirga sp.]|uniref:hypothetical protein n=1 Tax=Roseivirga sp. TaxID=1964215 RepID=UPI003B8D2C67